MSRKAMVTGASGGIGLELATRLAKVGHQVTLVARNARRLAEIVEGLGQGHRFIAADLSVPSEALRVAEDVRSSGYDLLINNAGVGVYGLFASEPLAPNQSMMRLNVDSLVELSHAFLEKAKEGDALMNVASALSLLSFPGGATYCATKAFVTAFSESLWWENEARGVYVCALLPGVTETNFHAAAGGRPDRTPPRAITQSAAAVAAAALRALERRASPMVLTSFTNKAMIFASTRLMPRKAMIRFMGSQSPVMKS